MILLTRSDGRGEIAVPLEWIAAASRVGGLTKLYIRHDTTQFEVRETPREIRRLVRDAKSEGMAIQDSEECSGTD